MMSLKISYGISLAIALAPSSVLTSVAQPALGRTECCGPRLLYTWWHADQAPAQAVGFVSPSVAVVVLHSGPEVMGTVDGPPLWRFKGYIGLHFGRAHHAPLPPSSLRENMAVMMPTRLALPKGWAIGTLPIAAAADTKDLAVVVRSRSGREAVCIWSLPTLRTSLIPSRRGIYPIALAFSPGDGHLAIGYSAAHKPGFICVRDVRNTKLSRVLAAPLGKPRWRPMAIAYLSPRRLVVSDWGLYIVRIRSHALARKVPLPPGLSHLAFRTLPGAILPLPAVGKFAWNLGLARPSIALYSCKKGLFLRTVRLRRQTSLSLIAALAGGPSRARMVVAVNNLTTGMSGFFAEISLATGRVIWRSPDISGGCTSVIISPDGKAAITGGMLGTRLWRLPPNRQ